MPPLLFEGTAIFKAKKSNENSIFSSFEQGAPHVSSFFVMAQKNVEKYPSIAQLTKSTYIGLDLLVHQRMCNSRNAQNVQWP